MTNPVEALTRALLEADGFDPDEELPGGYEVSMKSTSGIAKKWRKVAEIAVETLKGIGWGEVEPYREELRHFADEDTEGVLRNMLGDEIVHDCHRGGSSTCPGCWFNSLFTDARELLARPEVDA